MEVAQAPGEALAVGVAPGEVRLPVVPREGGDESGSSTSDAGIPAVLAVRVGVPAEEAAGAAVVVMDTPCPMMMLDRCLPRDTLPCR